MFKWKGLEISNVSGTTELTTWTRSAHRGAIYPYQQFLNMRPDGGASKLEPDLKHKDVQNILDKIALLLCGVVSGFRMQRV